MNLAEIYKNNDKHTINMRNMTAITLKIFQYILCKNVMYAIQNCSMSENTS